MHTGQKYQQRDVFTSNGDSNEKLSLKLAAPKFQKWSFQIFSKKQNPLKKSEEKLSFSDDAGLKFVTLLRKVNLFTMNTFFPSF